MERDMKTGSSTAKPAPARLIELVRGKPTGSRDQPDRGAADPDAVTERHLFLENDDQVGTGQPSGS
jgi:hypothetical protein